MRRKTFLFLFPLVLFLSTTTPAQVPDKEKVVAGAERAFEKLTKAYAAPAPGCAAAVSLNGETVFEKAFGLAELRRAGCRRHRLFVAAPVNPRWTSKIYFAINYVDDTMLIPVMATVVYIGKNLEPSDVGQVYFQDVESYRAGIRYGRDTEEEWADFQVGSENELSHIFKYEQALEALMRCSLNRKGAGSFN